MASKHIPNDITRAQVKALSAFLPQKHVAKYMKMDVKTLRKHYADIIYPAALDKDMQVVESLFANAIKGNVSAQIFWCKTRLGMSEQVASAHEEDEDTNENGIGKIEVVIAQAGDKQK